MVQVKVTQGNGRTKAEKESNKLAKRKKLME